MKAIDRITIQVIVVMLAVMVSLFWAKLHTTPSQVRGEVVLAREQILQAVESARRELHGEINALPSAIVLRLSENGDRLLRKIVNAKAN